MSALRVRPGIAEDLETLVEFNRAMALETEERELERQRLRAGVLAVLAPEAPGEAGARGFYRVAERDGKALGSLLVTREWSDWRDGWFWWIQSVYVRPESRRQGIYRALYAALAAEARENGEVCGLRLYVERENAGAQAVYERLGMRRSAYRLYEVDLVQGGS